MNLKQHNDIVQKLLKKIQNQQTQINKLNKQLHKSQNPYANYINTPNTLKTQNDSENQKKIAILHKQYKQKISNLTQQLSTKTNQNKNLLQKIATKTKLQAKHQDQVTQIMKKNGIYSQYDHKFASIISHYQQQLQKKNQHIAVLQKQIKQNYYKNMQEDNGQLLATGNTENNVQYDGNVEISKITEINSNKDKQVVKMKQEEISMLKSQLYKYKRLYDQQDKQYKDVTKRYSDLTKEYYRIVNQYGCDKIDMQKNIDKDMGKNMKKNTFNKNTLKTNKNTNSNKSSQNILSQLAQQHQNQQQQQSLNFSMQSDLNKIIAQKNTDKNNTQKYIQMNKMQNILNDICQILQLKQRCQIMPTLTKIKAKLDDMNIYTNIAKYIHSFLYRMGMGKIQMSCLIQQFQKFEIKINKMIESSEILDQACLQIGSKKQKLIQKIKDLQATQEQFFQNMKNIKFMKELPKANKVIEFIEYFQLDAQICQLPVQLKNIYQQLKYMDRFMRQSCLILEYDYNVVGKEGMQEKGNNMEKCLESVLRYLERKRAEESLQIIQKLQKQKSKKNSQNNK